MSDNGSCLKGIWLWCGPSIVVPLIALLPIMAWPVKVAISIGFLITMGYHLAGDPVGNADSETKSKTGIVVIYVVLQIIWILMFYCGLYWAICGMGGARF